jgi:hypothetical protein
MNGLVGWKGFSDSLWKVDKTRLAKMHVFEALQSNRHNRRWRKRTAAAIFCHAMDALLRTVLACWRANARRTSAAVRAFRQTLRRALALAYAAWLCVMDILRQEERCLLLATSALRDCHDRGRALSLLYKMSACASLTRTTLRRIQQHHTRWHRKFGHMCLCLWRAHACFSRRIRFRTAARHRALVGRCKALWWERSARRVSMWRLYVRGVGKRAVRMCGRQIFSKVSEKGQHKENVIEN